MSYIRMNDKASNDDVRPIRGAVIVAEEASQEHGVGVCMLREERKHDQCGVPVTRSIYPKRNMRLRRLARPFRSMKALMEYARGKKQEWQWKRKLSHGHPMFSTEFKDIGPLDRSIVEKEGKRIGDYHLDHKLGAGGFGCVYGSSSNNRIAIKALSKTTYYATKRRLARANVEIGILRRHGHHPNILKLKSVLHARRNIYIVTERAQLCLHTLLHNKPKTNIFEEQAGAMEQIMRGILTGTKYLHECGIAHRDIKSMNVLLCTSALDANNNLISGHFIDSNCVRLCDFGLAVLSPHYDPSNTDVASGVSWADGLPRKYGIHFKKPNSAGTPFYMAPEMHLSLKNQEARIADMWSIGVTFMEIAGHKIKSWKRISDLTKHGNLPAYKRRLARFLRKSRRDALLGCSPDLQDLLFQKLLVVECKKRANADEALKHPFFVDTVSAEGLFEC